MLEMEQPEAQARTAVVPPPSTPPSTPAHAPSASADNPFPQTFLPPTSYATKSDKIVCVMVGLPARGKSYISKRLSQYIQFFYGAPTKVFNVGDYRRMEAQGSYQSADFFDVRNEQAMAIRRKASEAALADLSAWMIQAAPHRLEPSKDDLFLSGDVRLPEFACCLQRLSHARCGLPRSLAA